MSVFAIKHIKKILESNNYNIRIEQYSDLFDIVASKNKDCYLIKIAIDGEPGIYNKSELAKLSITNGIVPLIIYYDTKCNRIRDVINVLNGQYSEIPIV